MKIEDDTIEFGDPDSFDAYAIEHAQNEDGEDYITLIDPFEDYVVLSSADAVQKCIGALEETLRFGWVK